MSEENPTQGPASGAAGVAGVPPPPAEDLLGSLKQLGEEFTGLLSEAKSLLGAESRLFVSSLVLIAVLLVTVSFLVIAVVVFVGVTVLLLLTEYGGLDGALAALLVVLGFAAVVAAMLLWVRRLTQNLTFSQSRKMLSDLATRKSTEGER